VVDRNMVKEMTNKYPKLAMNQILAPLYALSADQTKNINNGNKPHTGKLIIK
jgi:hypothetical protein